MNDTRLDLLKKHGLNLLDLDLRILGAMEDYAASRISELEAENKRLREEIENQQIEIIKKDEQIDRLREVATTAFRELELLKNEYKRLREALIDAKEDAAALIEQHRWIPVTERLPEENVGVLVFIPEEDNHITAGMWDVSQKWVLLDEYRIPECEVTHWQPLPPQPPKEQ